MAALEPPAAIAYAISGKEDLRTREPPVDVNRFRQLPLMGILRGGDADTIEPLVETVIATGLETLEVALNTPNAPELIRRAEKAAAGRLVIGAGTVLTVDLLESALQAGATFIVLPTLVPGVVARCKQKNIPVFPGAFTPQEIHNAWSAGATMVKVFPAKFLGPTYFREIKGPFADVELLACGGVTPDNIAAYFASGAAAVAFGGSVFKHEWLAARAFARIGDSIRALIAAARQTALRPGQETSLAES